LPLILAILVVAGILYYVIFRSMPPIILGIVVFCGAGLLFCMIRLITHKRKDRKLGSIGYGRPFKQRPKESPPSDDDREYERRLEEFRNRKEPWEGYRYDPLWEEPKVVDTKTVVCRRRRGEVHTAVLLVHEDGTIKVKCKGDCSDCVYEYDE